MGSCLRRFAIPLATQLASRSRGHRLVVPRVEVPIPRVESALRRARRIRRRLRADLRLELGMVRRGKDWLNPRVLLRVLHRVLHRVLPQVVPQVDPQMELREELPAVRRAARPVARKMAPKMSPRLSPRMNQRIDLATLSAAPRSVGRVARRPLRQTAHPRAFRGWMPSLRHAR
ncbi:MAG: hypothetical protein RL591_1502 [Planctomycetota bacterium]